MGKINYYKNLQSPNVLGTIEMEDWLNKISSGTEYQKTIEFARTLDKSIKSEYELYDAQKRILPCVTYNFLYNDRKKDCNVISSTNYLFLDIDDVDNFNIELIDKEYIYSYYHSLHNDGYHIILKVNGMSINKNIFSKQYTYIIDLLNLSSFIDKYAVKRTQFSVLSYDSNIYINNNASIIDLTDIDFGLLDAAKNDIVSNKVSNKEKKSVPSSLYLERGEEREGKCTGLGTKFQPFLNDIKFTNKKEIIKVDGLFETNWNGWKIVECKFPKIIKNGTRYSILSAYCYNLKWLNPTMPYNQCKMFLNTINNNNCIDPLSQDEINRIVYGCYSKENIEPIYTIKKIGYGDDKITGYDKEDKLDIARQLVNKHKVDMSREKLYEIIEGWNFEQYGKISIRKVADNFPINKKTVAKYWNEYKEYVNDLNRDYLEAVSDTNTKKMITYIK